MDEIQVEHQLHVKLGCAPLGRLDSDIELLSIKSKVMCTYCCSLAVSDCFLHCTRIILEALNTTIVILL